MNLAKPNNQGAAENVARPITDAVMFLTPICNMPWPRNPLFYWNHNYQNGASHP